MAQYISQGGIGPTTMLPCDSGSLTICFDPTTVWYAVKTGKRGYSESFSESAI